MRKIYALASMIFFASATIAQPSVSATVPTQPTPVKEKVTLPNGWHLTPAGSSLELGDLPLNIVVSPSKKYIAATNNGQSVQSIQLIDAKNDVLLDTRAVPKSWFGLKFSADEKTIYASGGNDNWIFKIGIENNKLILEDTIMLGKKWPVKISPTGLDVNDSKNILYVVTKENNSLYIVNLSTKETQTIPLSAEAFTCLLSPDKKELYISLWGGDKILVLDTKTNALTDSIAVGDNPNDICLTKNGKYLFVANANDNSVSVIDTKQRKVIETFNTALYPNSPSGSTTNGVALSKDEKTLYASNADNNCLAVFDVSKPGSSVSKGFIPTGWYPTSVKVIGDKIYVANGKGFSSFPNPFGPNPIKRFEQVNYQRGDMQKPSTVQYIAGLMKGTLSIINVPTEKEMGEYSKQVYDNTPYNKDKELMAQGQPGNPIPMKVGDASPIKHVFYIIKENRTYDQVLGDMPEGNGDTQLVLFPEKITPNQHAICREFVLLDNFYCDGEVSADGHEWSMGAYATDYLEKTWPTSYGGRGGEYDSEGNRPIANNKGGYIWDHCSRAGVSFRTYGEFADDYKPNIPVLKNHLCPYYRGWDLDYYDTARFGLWKRDFDSMMTINQVPQFNSLRFGNDHTEGLRKGKLTPFALVAENDRAVGMFIDYLSKTPLWKESVVFIVEDDAQAGPDHVDAHRTTAYVAGGFVKRHFVDHTMYSTTSMLRTIELILGLPPMTQYDAASTPMWNCFMNTADLTPFNSVLPNIDVTEKNVAINEWQRQSETFNFAKEDAVPDLQFNIVLWHAIKGDKVQYPGPTRAAFLKLPKGKRDDDDD